LIVKKGRQKKSRSKKYFEIYRVIDDTDVVLTLSRLKGH